jgi:hypothetical protein
VEQMMQMLKEFCNEKGYELNINYMSENDAKFILAIMSYYWGLMEAYPDIQEETHRTANILRKSMGMDYDG